MFSRAPILVDLKRRSDKPSKSLRAIGPAHASVADQLHQSRLAIAAMWESPATDGGTARVGKISEARLDWPPPITGLPAMKRDTAGRENIASCSFRWLPCALTAALMVAPAAASGSPTSARVQTEIVRGVSVSPAATGSGPGQVEISSPAIIQQERQVVTCPQGTSDPAQPEPEPRKRCLQIMIVLQ